MEYLTGSHGFRIPFGLFLLGALCLSATGVAQSPVDRDTQWGEWVQKEPRSTVTRVQASLEAGNPIHLGAFLTLFEHYRLLWAEGKQMREFLISLASVDKKLAETLLLFALTAPRCTTVSSRIHVLYRPQHPKAGNTARSWCRSVGRMVRSKTSVSRLSRR